MAGGAVGFGFSAVTLVAEVEAELSLGLVEPELFSFVELAFEEFDEVFVEALLFGFEESVGFGLVSVFEYDEDPDDSEEPEGEDESAYESVMVVPK